MASDNDFFILRKFAPESARVALWMQDKVSLLSEQLSEADKRYQEYGAHSGRFRTKELDQRSVLLTELANELDRYRKYKDLHGYA